MKSYKGIRYTFLTVMLLVLFFSGCKKETSSIYKFYDVKDLKFLTPDDMSTNIWIKLMEETEAATSANLFIDTTLGMMDYMNAEETNKYVSVLCSFENICFEALDIWDYRSFTYINAIGGELLLTEFNEVDGFADKAAASYSYYHDMSTARTSIKYNDYYSTTTLYNLPHSKSDIMNLIDYMYSSEQQNINVDKSLNIVMSNFKNENDYNFEGFYKDMQEYAVDYGITYGIICINQEDPVFVVAIGDEGSVSAFIQKASEEVVNSCNIDNNLVSYAIPDMSNTVKTSEIPVNANNTLILENQEINYLIKKGELDEYINEKEFAALDEMQIKNFSPVDLYPLEYIEGAGSDLIGRMEIEFPISHPNNSWIIMESWILSQDDIDIKCVFAQIQKSQDHMPKKYREKLHPIGELDISQNKYDYLTYEVLQGKSNLNPNNIEDWDTASNIYEQINVLELIDANYNIMEITSISSVQDNTNFAIDYVIHTQHLPVDIPVMIDVKLNIKPIYQIRNIPSWAQEKEMYKNLIFPLYDAVSLENIEDFKREVVLIVNKTPDVLSSPQKSELISEGVVFLDEMEIHKINSEQYIDTNKLDNDLQSQNTDIEDMPGWQQWLIKMLTR